jgi:PKD repeat protein
MCWRNGRTIAALGLCMALAGCGVNEVDIPDLFGPSERAESLVLRATPDVLVADGSSFSVVEGVFRDRNGQPLPGRAILFKIGDESGNEISLGSLSSDAGKGNTITDNNGVARVIYTSPPRTDATANQSILIMGRAVGTDFNGESYRYVRIELRSAEPRLFPAVPGNALPFCNFLWETPNGVRAPAFVQFNTTSNDSDGTIIRYEWYFSDDIVPGRIATYSPDTGHVFRQAGTWTVTHIVTDDDGGQSACAADFTILP